MTVKSAFALIFFNLRPQKSAKHNPMKMTTIHCLLNSRLKKTLFIFTLLLAVSQISVAQSYVENAKQLLTLKELLKNNTTVETQFKSHDDTFLLKVYNAKNLRSTSPISTSTIGGTVPNGSVTFVPP